MSSQASAANTRAPSPVLHDRVDGRGVGRGSEASGPPAAGEQPDLLESILRSTGAAPAAAGRHSDLTWLYAMAREARSDSQVRQDLRQLLAEAVVRLDAMISRQLNAILHHPRLQKLEASWRGLRYLIEGADREEGVKVRVLNASWVELARDAERALEFDQSVLFRKVYEDEFGTPGGEPFGILIGDYQVRHQPGPDHPTDDVAVLSFIAQVAAAAFAPFIAGAHPALLGLQDFSSLERPLNLARTFEQPEYLRWRTMRDSPDSRFVGLTLPRVLMRLPYDENSPAAANFYFREEIGSPDAGTYLWGNAAYAFGAVAVRSFVQTRWLADIRGVRRGEEGGGVVNGLPCHWFETDTVGVASRSPTDVIITDQQERYLSELGLIPLSACKDTPFAAFYGNQSLQKPRRYADAATTANARISAMLQYILCASRFAHYLKVMGRDKVGTFQEATQLADMLSKWLVNYALDDANASQEMKARYPLRSFEVNVREMPHKPGVYNCELLLQPHSQWDELSVGVRLLTELAPARSA